MDNLYKVFKSKIISVTSGNLSLSGGNNLSISISSSDIKEKDFSSHENIYVALMDEEYFSSAHQKQSILLLNEILHGKL